MARDLPANPDLEHLRKQAKDLLRDLERGDPTALERYHALGARRGAKAKLADAQRLVAREYGFSSWSRLKSHVESLGKSADVRIAASAAIRANDAAELETLLRKHPELRARVNEPLPQLAFDTVAIVAAADRGSREMVDVLLRAGADIDARSHWWAGGFGVLDVCPPAFATYLIERGATVDANAAARLDMRDALDQIVTRDANAVHARGGDGQTPLHVAASVEIAAYLLDHGADIDALDIDHESTPAQYALRDRQDVARYLVSRGGKTDILMAAALGDVALVRRHLEADPASIRTTVSDKYFPMKNPRAGGTIYIWTLSGNMTPHLAAMHSRHNDVFELLMAHSSDELKLAVAGELGDTSLMRELLAKRPDLVRRLNDDEQAKLVAAAQHEHFDAVRMMLEVGWPIDARGQHGATALHWAAFNGHADMVREILRYSPPLEIRDRDFNGTPLGWGIYASVHGAHPWRGDYAGAVEALLAAGAKLPDEDPQASDAVRTILSRYRAKSA